MLDIFLILFIKVMGRASSFKQHYESGYSSDSLATSVGGPQRAPTVQSREDEMKKWVNCYIECALFLFLFVAFGRYSLFHFIMNL